MINKEYMDEHNIDRLETNIRQDMPMGISITFKNGDKLVFDVEEGLIDKYLPSTVNNQVSQYEWKLLQKERRKKINKLKKEK